MKKAALFIDRDGIINEMVLQRDGVYDSPRSAEQVALVPGMAEVISWLNKKDIPVIEASNQPGVAKGTFSLPVLESIESKVHNLLRERGARIDKAYRCLHHPEASILELKIDCQCRKPKPGLLTKAADELGLDLKKSAILGDNASDVEAGQKLGCKTILLFHLKDQARKVEASRRCHPDFRIRSHREVIPILRKLFA